MASQIKTYPIVQNAINLFGDWLKHRREIGELRGSMAATWRESRRIFASLPPTSMPSSARVRTPATSCRGS